MGKFNPERDIMFSREDVMQGLQTRRFGKIFADEMINTAYNRDFFAGEQKELIKWLNMYRDNHNILIGCVPNFYDLDTQVRKLCKFRITLIERGVGIFQVAKSSMYINDPWETRVNEKIEMKWKNGKSKKTLYKKLTTYKGLISFGALSDKQEVIYTKLKRQKREEMLNKDIEIDPKNKPYYVQAIELIKSGVINSMDLLNKFLDVHKVKYYSGHDRIRKELKQMGVQDGIVKLFKLPKEVKISTPSIITSNEGLKNENLPIALKTM